MSKFVIWQHRFGSVWDALASGDSPSELLASFATRHGPLVLPAGAHPADPRPPSSWLDQLDLRLRDAADALSVLRHLPQPTALPTSVGELLDLRRRLGLKLVHAASADELQLAGRAYVQARVPVAQAGDEALLMVVTLVRQVEDALDRAAAAGDALLVRPDDFGPALGGWLANDSKGGSVYGVLSALPPGHALRSHLQRDDFVRTVAGPAVVLGAGDFDPVREKNYPKRWYVAGEVVSMTRSAAVERRDQEERAVQEARREAQEFARRAALAVEGSADSLRQRVDALERQLAAAGGR